MPHCVRRALPLAVILSIAGSTLALAQVRPTPTPAAPRPELTYQQPFFPGAEHDRAIPTPKQLIGIDAGDRAATHAEIEKCFRTWADISDRATLVEHAKTYEGRSMFHLIITRPDRQSQLDDIKAAYASLADPDGLSDAEAKRIMQGLPAVAWLGHSIHGDETSGADGALALAYHLVSDNSAQTQALLDDLVIIIDPMMNPDGRDRFLKMVAENRGNVPNTDYQSLVHTGDWPAGRGNHYLFDLNRDSIFGIHPETRGRLEAVSEWHPLLFVDAHEMWPLDTYLFAPGRAPMNVHFPERRAHWGEVFAEDQSSAFDQMGWRYYTGEWNEGWYPGYTDSWAALRSAVGILYEQARIADAGIQRPEGRVETYKESVHKQALSALTNLRTLRANKAALLSEFLDERRENIARDGEFSGRVFAINAGNNEGRLQRFIDLMDLQGVELYRAEREFKADGKDWLGDTFESKTFIAGSLLIPSTQPEARLAAALLELDTPMSDEFLTEERRELLRFGESRLYDITAWNIPMLYGLEASELSMTLPRDAERVTPGMKPAGVESRDPQVGWAFNGADDRSVAAAAQLMERGVQARMLDKDTTLGGRPFERGTVIVFQIDNESHTGLVDAIDEVARTLGMNAYAIDTGFGPGDAPDLGGGHLQLLRRPRIAVVGRNQVDPTDYGAIWHTIDHVLGVRASYLDSASLEGTDLREYNTIVVPNASGALIKRHAESLKKWVAQGGTLIAIGASAGAAADESAELSGARSVTDSLGDLESHAMEIIREAEGHNATAKASSVYTNALEAIEYPWANIEELPSEEELKRRDSFQEVFMPQGAILAARVDDRNWLTVGLGDMIPVLYTGGTTLMAKRPTQAPVRFGVYVDAPEEPKASPSSKSEKEDESSDEEVKSARRGFAPAPIDTEPRLRMSGLLWPEAAQRLMNTAYLTRDSVGNGQVILFASPPTFRGTTFGTTRLLHNALIYGPGCGTSQPVRP
jgi:hypothetical protein